MFTFLNHDFDTEAEMHAYMYWNRHDLLPDFQYKKRYSLLKGSVGGFFLGFFLFFLGLNSIHPIIAFFYFIVPMVGIPYFLVRHRTAQLAQLENGIQKYERTFDKKRKQLESMFDRFTARYFDEKQQRQHLPEFLELINHKHNLHLTIGNLKYLLEEYELDKDIELINNKLSKYKNISAEKIANALLDVFPDIDIEDDDEREWLIDRYTEFVNRYDYVHYGIGDIQSQLIEQYKNRRLSNFERKLSRNPDDMLTVAQIQHLDGYEFESLLAKIFKKAGYKVKNTPKSGDQGADLIIEKNSVSTAVQAKKYAGSVGNSAVQQAVAAMKFYDCDKSMVITTGKFTKSAFELAGRNGVQLIDKDGLDDLFDSVM